MFLNVMAAVCGARSSAPSFWDFLGLSTRMQLPPLPIDSGTEAAFFRLHWNPSMKKIVPDPPLFTCAHQGTSLFAINPGVPVQDALKHASLLLKGAELTADDIRSHLSGFEAEQLWCVIHGVELARGLVDALITETHT